MISEPISGSLWNKTNITNIITIFIDNRCTFFTVYKSAVAVLNQYLAPLPFSPGWQMSWNSPSCRKLTKTKLEGSWKWRCVASPAISCGAPVSLLIRPWYETQKNSPTKVKKLSWFTYLMFFFRQFYALYSLTDEFLFCFCC